ncbi:MAG TPA: DUF4956 domain-containing protein [Candidatus Polarisedimenticolaceae bacterium]|nr:DUF4956 domain-containing protein [Candidatus Polarisedimenticolaceae bacterium]
MDALVHALDGGTRLAPEQSLESLLLTLLLSFVLGQIIAWTYVWTHSGLSYSRSFTQSLVLMCLVVTLVMVVIGSSIVTAFGLLGALALIRFRNVLKDTRDTVFILISLVIGMAVGSQRYLSAILGTATLLLVVIYLNSTSFGTLGRYDGYLTLRLAPPDRARDIATRLLDRFCRRIKQVSTRQAGDEDEAEFVYQVGLRDRERGSELLAELRQLEGVRHVSLVLRNELSEV